MNFDLNIFTSFIALVQVCYKTLLENSFDYNYSTSSKINTASPCNVGFDFCGELKNLLVNMRVVQEGVGHPTTFD